MLIVFPSFSVRIQGLMKTDQRDTTGWWTESTEIETASCHPTENHYLLTNTDARYPLNAVCCLWPRYFYEVSSFH